MVEAARESLAEDLILLALDDAHGTLALPAARLQPALATALVLDLVTGGQMAVIAGNPVITNQTPTGDPIRDHALYRIATAPRRGTLPECSAMIAEAMPDLATALREQLVARGVLHRQGNDRYPACDGAMEGGLRERIRAAAHRDGQADSRTAVVVSLACAYGLEECLLPVAERQTATPRLRQIAAELHRRTRAILPPVAGAAAMAGTAAVVVAATQTEKGQQIVGAIIETGAEIATDATVSGALELVGWLVGGLLAAIFDN